MFFRDVELGTAFACCTLLSKSCHEFVQVGLELFFDTVWPVVLAVQLRNVLVVHLVEEVIKRVSVHLARHDLILDLGRRNCFLPAPLYKI